jgi:hypothetical protein
MLANRTGFAMINPAPPTLQPGADRTTRFDAQVEYPMRSTLTKAKLKII